MKYFIPAWYQQNKWWQDRNGPFYMKEHKNDFDDMMSLMRMHIGNNAPFTLIQLSYHTAFQLFLHRNELYEASYYSIFDEIQKFPQSAPKALDYRDFKWKKGTEFIYTLYIIKAVYNNETTNIYYNEDGYLAWMEQFVDKVKVSRYIFDNRGFLSSIILFKEGKKYSQLYIDIDGDVVLKEDLNTSCVTVCKYFEQYERTAYDSLPELIQEKLAQFIKTHAAHSVVAAYDEQHNDLIQNVIPEEQLTYSIFKQRNRAHQYRRLNYKYIVDVQSIETLLKSQQVKNVLRITPFDTSKLPSISSQFYVDFIGLYIDGMSEDKIIDVIEHITPMLTSSKKFKLKLLTKHNDKSVRLHSIIKDINEAFIEQNEDTEDMMEDELQNLEIIQFEMITFEVDLIAVVSKLRIIIDLNEEPDLFLQIAGVSTGVPQINKVATDYVEHKQNGYIIHQIDELLDGLVYYLNHLKHWNLSLSYSFKLIDQYSSRNIIDKIDEFIEGGTYGKEI